MATETPSLCLGVVLRAEQIGRSKGELELVAIDSYYMIWGRRCRTGLQIGWNARENKRVLVYEDKNHYPDGRHGGCCGGLFREGRGGRPYGKSG